MAWRTAGIWRPLARWKKARLDHVKAVGKNFNVSKEFSMTASV
jgi:hypothetical protein